MYVETVPNRNSPPAVLLREGWREGHRVHKRTIANLSHWPASKVARLRQLLKDQPLVHPEEAFTIDRALPHGHVALILHLLRRLDLPALLDRKRSRPRDLVLAMLAQRLLAPTSKLAATRLWHTTTLAQELALDNADEDDLYDAMDWLLERQERIERRLAARHLTDGGHVLYDVSSSYYEGRACALAQFGYSRDGKRGRPIVVYGLMTDAAGRPVAVQAYEGNTADPNTVPNQVAKLRDRFGLERVVLVGDRGMLTQTQIDHLKQHPGLGWISALRHTDIRRLFEQGAVQTSLFDARNLAEITVAAYPDERLVVCHNPILAERRRRKRDALLRATEEAFAARSSARWRGGPGRRSPRPPLPRKSGARRTASRWPSTSKPSLKTTASPTSARPPPLNAKRPWTGTTSSAPANRPRGWTPPPWSAATRTSPASNAPFGP